MNEANDHQPAAAPPSGAVQNKCLVCGKPLDENRFCRINRKGGPILLCSPKCLIDYSQSKHGSANNGGREIRAYENNFPLLVGQERPPL
jgi:hypothetical protein